MKAAQKRMRAPGHRDVVGNAQHLARTAFTAMADIAPHMNALTTRAALNLLI